MSNFNIDDLLPTIERCYPNKKTKKSYPGRYDISVFEKLNEMKTDTKLQNDYKKWKDGINYNTNRKIKIGLKLHNKLKEKFMINLSYCSSVLFEDLLNINVDEYLQETKKIYNEIDAENTIIEKYNNTVKSVIERIQKLEKWNDFVEFEGKNYGLIDKIKNNIHIENDCLGEMIFIREETEDRFDNIRPFCYNEDTSRTFSVYKCSKCNYEKFMIKY